METHPSFMVIYRVYYGDFGWLLSELILPDCDFIFHMREGDPSPTVNSDYDERNKSDTTESEWKYIITWHTSITIDSALNIILNDNNTSRFPILFRILMDTL